MKNNITKFTSSVERCIEHGNLAGAINVFQYQAEQARHELEDKFAQADDLAEQALARVQAAIAKRRK